MEKLPTEKKLEILETPPEVRELVSECELTGRRTLFQRDGRPVAILVSVDEYLALVTTLVLAFGICFQMPVVLALLARVRILGASALRKGRRYAIVGIAAFSSLVTPPDVLSMTLMAIPMYLLYEVSIWIVALIEAAQKRKDAAEEAAAAAVPPAP